MTIQTKLQRLQGIYFALAIISLLFLIPSSGWAASISLTGYNSEGKNTGTDYVNEVLQVSPYVQGTTDTRITWSVSSGAGTIAPGTGSLATSGMYQAPSTMPSNNAVTVTATLVATPSVSATYSFNIINPVPAITGVSAKLLTAATNTVTVQGSGFNSQTKILVNGNAVPTTFSSSGSVTASIAVPAGAVGTLPISASNPAPGGGTGASYNAPVAPVTISLNGYNSEGKNTGTDYVSEVLQVSPYVQGTGDTRISWSVSAGVGTIAPGTGSLASSGMYQAPSTMPSSNAVTVTATLVATPSVSTSYSFNIINPVPAITGVSTKLLTAATNNVTVQGSGFTSQTKIMVNGTAVPTTFSSAGSVTASLTVAAGATGTLPISASTPSPGGGNSATYNAPIAAVSIALSAYNSEGKNAGTDSLNEVIQVSPYVQGTGDTRITWSVSSGAGAIAPGTGSLATSGMYQAPSAMPSNTSVTVTATLVATPSVSTSYSFNIINPVPVIKTVYGQALAASTQNVALGGSGFVPGSVILVNGSQVATTYQSATQISARVTASSCATGSFTVTVQNPAPGGGTSAAANLPVAPMNIQITAFGTGAAANPTSTALGTGVQFYANLQGSGNPSVAWPVTWSVQGGGTISASGLYRAPSTMPSSSALAVNANLTSCPAISGSYALQLSNPTPIITGTNPGVLSAGSTNVVTIQGARFVPGTTVLANGAPVSTSYSSSGVLTAMVPVASNATSVSLSAQSPDPGGSTGTSFTVAVGSVVPVAISIDPTHPGLAIPQNFLGLSHEWGSENTFEGSAATGVNQAYRQLVQNLMNGESYKFFIRIGGSSTDSTTEPTATTVSAYSDLAKALPLQYSLGVNLGSDNVQLAVDQAVNYSNAMPNGSLAAIEIGNEPDLYYSEGLRSSSSYIYLQYLQDFDTWRQAITSAAPTPVSFVGPSWAGAALLQQYFPTFEQLEATFVPFTSQHFYAGCICRDTIGADFLLQPSAATSGATQVASAVQTAHLQGQRFRVGEMNSISGGTVGGVAGVSDSFTSALWAVDTMFEFANVGVDGVNWHGNKNCPFCAFSFAVNSDVTNGNSGQLVFTLTGVNPIYYGMLFFRSATPAGSQLLPVTLPSGMNVNLKAWATQDASGNIRVAIINKDENSSASVSFSLPSSMNTAQVARLTAPSYRANQGVTFQGQTFDGSIDGTPVGSPIAESSAPSSNGTYTITVQPASAALVTIPAH